MWATAPGPLFEERIGNYPHSEIRRSTGWKVPAPSNQRCTSRREERSGGSRPDFEAVLNQIGDDRHGIRAAKKGPEFVPTRASIEADFHRHPIGSVEGASRSLARCLGAAFHAIEQGTLASGASSALVAHSFRVGRCFGKAEFTTPILGRLHEGVEVNGHRLLSLDVGGRSLEKIRVAAFVQYSA
jgi:hypothetical protein